MEKNFNPNTAEKKIYETWIKEKYFSPDTKSNKESFTISMPPPNITGELHLGHALNATLQDILIRYKRMQGYNTLWMPGTDHASISTEMKITASLKNITKEDLGREEFLKKAWQWKEKYGGIIVEQLKKLGVSCDWSRERFTMDEGLSSAVEQTFINLYKKGYIYKDKKLINWCPTCKTTISDAEVVHNESISKIYYMRYSVIGTDTYLTFATTRPETILGDVALAVNPKDERYVDYIGKSAIVPIVNREIPIVSDSYVDIHFGSGVVKITPGHDFNDYELAIRHNLSTINIFNEDATVNEIGIDLAGLDRYTARTEIINKFKQLGLFIKEEEIKNSVSCHDKCDTVMEPLNKMQWFVKMDKMAQTAIEAYTNGHLNFVPPRFSKNYLSWLENIKDWCISRQLWWGHRIPAYYCKCGHITVESTASLCKKCGSSDITQDEDVLDTWFSSALWPFSTLGWPQQTEDLNKFYPTNVLVTGPDIIFFWVVRMVFSGIEQTGKIPFKDVILNGIVRDSQGRKMSKTLGNGINPLELIEVYGADALRITLIIGNSLGADQRFSKEKLEANRNFLNKIWNAARFIKMNEVSISDESYTEDDLSLQDKWIINKLNSCIEEITQNIEQYEIGIALQKIYDFAWDEYCDWYIEMAKTSLKEENKKVATITTLKRVLTNILRMLHPYAPFVTEEIFTNIQDKEKTLMLSAWPTSGKTDYTKEEEIIETIKNIVKNIRNIRRDMNVSTSRKIKIIIVPQHGEEEGFILTKDLVKTLATGSEVLVKADKNGINKDAVVITIPTGEIYLEGLLDKEKEIKRLLKEKQSLEKEIDRAVKNLNNHDFMAKAPAKLVKAEEDKKLKFSKLLENVDANIENLYKLS